MSYTGLSVPTVVITRGVKRTTFARGAGERVSAEPPDPFDVPSIQPGFDRVRDHAGSRTERVQGSMRSPGADGHPGRVTVTPDHVAAELLAAGLVADPLDRGATADPGAGRSG